MNKIKLDKLNGIIGREEVVEIYFNNKTIFTGNWYLIPPTIRSGYCTSISTNNGIISMKVRGKLK